MSLKVWAQRLGFRLVQPNSQEKVVDTLLPL
ncbi:MAG: hypothetical protein HW390_744 [Candidatus Brocadiaceae bacterium]|nr:hypothetical protein [Candidatus Brocadiaceae bacterium]